MPAGSGVNEPTGPRRLTVGATEKNENMREHETAALERHGDTQASEKAKQHRFLLAQDAADPQLKLGPDADATGDHGAELAGE